MKKKQHSSKIRPVLFAVGAGLTLSLASIPIANAATGQFGVEKLSSGYNVADAHGKTSDKADKKCGCGDKNGDNSKDKSTDGKCGGGKCGAGKCGS